MQNIAECVKPQMIVHLLEYLVAFALVINHSGEDAANKVKASHDIPAIYLRFRESNQICFPDHRCGPDIIYKCDVKKTIYIAQAKFVKKISKQEAANSCDTTDPKFFYCGRKVNQVLKGSEEWQSKLRSILQELQNEGYKVQQLLFTHSGGNEIKMLSLLTPRLSQITSIR